MRRLLFILSIVGSTAAFCQNAQDTTATKVFIDSLNRQIDRAVVQKNIPFLQKHFADDFRFFHATGMIDSKQSWIGKAESGGDYFSREHDSTSVELHIDIALVTGTLTVLFPPNHNGYAVRYIRVYAFRNQVWQMVSHHSTAQWVVGKK
ncbi:MAG: nuclear transport factor 2 family protein [Flavisolibacter sp.]